jgi:hypothetical protein
MAKATDSAVTAGALVPKAPEASSPSNLPSSVQASPHASDVLNKAVQSNRSDNITASSAVQRGLSSPMDVKAPSFVPSASQYATPTIAQQSISPNLDAGATDFVSRGKGAAKSSSTLVHGGPPVISAPSPSKSDKESSPVHRSTETSSPQSPNDTKAGIVHKLNPVSLPLGPQLNTESPRTLQRPDQVSRTTPKKPTQPTSLPSPKEEKAKTGFGMFGSLANMASRATRAGVDMFASLAVEDETLGLPTTVPTRNPNDAARDSPSNAVLRSPELAPYSNARPPSTQATTSNFPPLDSDKLQKTTGTISGSSKPAASRRKQDDDTALPTVSASPSTAKVTPQEQASSTKEQAPNVLAEVANSFDIAHTSTLEPAPEKKISKDIVVLSIPVTMSSSQTEPEPGLSISIASPAAAADEKPTECVLSVGSSSSKESTKEGSNPAESVEVAEPTAMLLPNSPTTEHQEERKEEKPHVQQPQSSTAPEPDGKPDEQPLVQDLPLAPSASGSAEAAAVPIAETTPAETIPEATTPSATTSVFSKRIDDLVIQVKPGASPFPVAIFEVIFPTEYTIPTFDDEGSGSEEGDVSGAARTPMPKPHRELSELS